MKKYYWDGGILRSTTAKITKKFVYTKKIVYKNNLGTIYKTKKSAINGRIKQLRKTNERLEAEILGCEMTIDYNNKEITKLKKNVAKKSKR